MSESEKLLMKIAETYLFEDFAEEVDSSNELDEYRGIGIRMCEELAERENASACATLSIYYYWETHNNEKAQEWKKKSIELFRKNSESGDAEAQFTLARYLLHSKYKKEAIELLGKAAEQGHINAMLYLGEAYNVGRRYGVEEDEEKAKTWFEKSAENGCPEAYLLLAQFHLNFEEEDTEEPTGQDVKIAFEYIQKAAECGIPAAYALLSECYLLGIGTERDEDKAFALSKLCNGIDHEDILLSIFNRSLSVSDIIKYDSWCANEF